MKNAPDRKIRGIFFWVLQTVFVGAGEACDLLILPYQR
jgi:hypothetical protein